MSDSPKDDRKPQIPSPDERLELQRVSGTHPAVISPEILLEACELRTQRRSGPGGQHRNKTSSGVFLTHRPTGIVGEATERRSQAQNRDVALGRLRFRLAVEIRTASIIDDAEDKLESELRGRYRGKSLKMNDSNAAKPAVLALVLNDLHAAGGQPSAVAPIWKASTSAIIALLKSHPSSFQLLNRIRIHHGRWELK